MLRFKLLTIFTLLISPCSYAVEMQVMSEYTDSEKDIIKELQEGINKVDPILPPLEKVTEDESAKKVLEILKDTKRTYTPSFQKKGSLNQNLTVYRDSDQIVTVNMSINDVIDTNICAQSPVRIILGNTVTDTILQAISDSPDSIDSKVLEGERSVIVFMKREMKNEGAVFRTRVRLIRKSDNRAYIININAQACPSSGRFSFPSEVIIEEKQGVSANENNKLMTPVDLIFDITNGFPRKNHENQIELYGGLMAPGSDYTMIAINVKIGNTTREDFYPQFYVLDSLRGRIIGMQEPIYLEPQSKAVSERVGHPIVRFNLFLNINKKYIIERSSIHLIMVEHGEKYYQSILIPMGALREKLINHGYDLN